MSDYAVELKLMSKELDLSKSDIPIKSCPFCGSKLVGCIGKYIGGITGEIRTYSCANCGASSGWRESAIDAITAWNRRADDE